MKTFFANLTTCAPDSNLSATLLDFIKIFDEILLVVNQGSDYVFINNLAYNFISELKLISLNTEFIEKDKFVEEFLLENIKNDEDLIIKAYFNDGLNQNFKIINYEFEEYYVIHLNLTSAYDDKFKTLNTLIGSYAHDLKTACYAAHLGANNILKSETGNLKADSKHILELIAQDTNSAHISLKDLKEITAYLTGQVKLIYQNFNIKRLLEKLHKKYINKLASKNLKLDLDLEEVEISVSKVEFIKALMHLLDYSIYKAAENSEIKILVRLSENITSFSFRVNSEPLDDLELKHLFTTFQNYNFNTSKGCATSCYLADIILSAHLSKLYVKNNTNGFKLSFDLFKNLGEL
jgi:signal transduction histidine kinase